jgi:phosphohistidine phosphatase
MMDCLLFRHGIAIDPEDWEGEEALRPLTPKGIEKAREAVAGLRRLDLVPTHILSSPFKRAIDTAKLLSEQFKAHLEVQVCDELLPDAPSDKLLPLLASLPDDACVACVGHEPQLGEAAGVMLFGRPVAGLSLKKAGACCIGFERPPKAGGGFLKWWMTPAQLRKLAKD